MTENNGNWFDSIVSTVQTALEAVFVKKSNTSGLLKNDGTVDTNTYLTSVPSHNQNLSTINNTSTVAVNVVYTDSTTGTLNLVTYNPPSQ